MRIACVAIACSFVAYASAADDPFFFRGQFPQLRDLSGLPGAGFGVTVNGKPSFMGAMSLSTPIGFSLGGGVFDVGAASRSTNDQPQFINLTHGKQTYHSSGRLVGMGGIHTPLGNLTLGYEVVSSAGDGLYNAQLQLPLKWEKGGVSVGVQNFTNRPEAAADSHPGETDLSRSVFVVGTYEFMRGGFVSVGKGDVRFKGLFGNLSVSPYHRVKLTTEYDTFGFNSGAAYSLGKVPNLGDHFDDNEMTLWVGFVKEQRMTIALNFAF